jgi:hypothetical protein
MVFLIAIEKGEELLLISYEKMTKEALKASKFV